MVRPTAIAAIVALLVVAGSSCEIAPVHQDPESHHHAAQAPAGESPTGHHHGDSAEHKGETKPCGIDIIVPVKDGKSDFEPKVRPASADGNAVSVVSFPEVPDIGAGKFLSQLRGPSNGPSGRLIYALTQRLRI